MKKLFTWGLAVILLAILTMAGAWWWYSLFVNTPHDGTGTVIVTIKEGSGFKQIATLLAENGVIRDDPRFLLLARLEDSAGRLQAGEFAISRNLKPGEVLHILEQGEVIRYRVTIPEGLTFKEIARIYGEKNWIDEEEFLRLCEDSAFINALGIKQQNLEGYLFPNTYIFTRNELNSRTIITTMVRKFFTIWDEVSKGTEIKLDRHEVITLASIIEKETGAAHERPLIAGVFFNRLNMGMRLQTDPTVIYGIKDFDGNLTRLHLRTKTPYNTYMIDGLPPGPIANPGRASIYAVFNPEETDAIYFVSRNDGTHVFSGTLRGHNRAVRIYQKSR
jgi:UPF0755 protein